MHLEGSRVDAVLLGLAGFRLLAAREVGGEVELTVETTATVVGCSGCGVRAHSKGRKPVLVRDVDAFGRPVRLPWVKRRWRCPEPACAVATWTEQSTAIRPRRAMTERARVRACRRVGRDGESVAAVARSFAVGWHHIMGAVLEVGAPLVDEPARTNGVWGVGRGRDQLPAHRPQQAHQLRHRPGRPRAQPPARRGRRARRPRRPGRRPRWRRTRQCTRRRDPRTG